MPDFAIQQFEHQLDGMDHFLIIINDPDSFHSRCALILSANALLIPGTALNSTTDASLILSTEPK